MEAPKSHVARAAKQSAHLPGGVTVIDAKRRARLLLADRADAVLAQQHALKVPLGQSIPPPALPVGALLSLRLAKFRVALELLRVSRPPETAPLSCAGAYFFPIIRILGISLPSLFVGQRNLLKDARATIVRRRNRHEASPPPAG
jgi:hypothetical protein